MSKKFQLSRIAALVIGFSTVAFSSAALADPPSRVARLGYASGAVSFSPAGDDDWVVAKLNRPLITGDRLWVDAGGRDELQIGNATLRMSGNTSVTLLNLDDRTSQVQVSQGVVILHVRRLDEDELIEIDTPNLAFSIQAPGDYRIHVDPRNDSTTIAIRSGEGQAFGENESYNIDAGRLYRFEGSDLRNYEDFSLPRSDDFDRWSAARDLRLSRSNSARYVSRDIIGYEDLDEHGSWTTVATYGNVWVPSHVAADWAPYRDGHWSWVEPWGWTWIDDAPWGFAVSHYGRWANTGHRWCWVPGPIAARPVYAPALVAFVGGNNFRLSISSGNVGGVAWFPLAPREVYRPAYHVSGDYFANINTSNTTINRTTVTNVYNNINVTNVTNVTYVNRQVPGALVAMPANAFVQSQQVTRAAVRVTAQEIATAPIAFNAAVAPMRVSVTGAAVQGVRPPAEAQARPVVVRTEPPALPPSFSVRQSALAQHPGRPLEPAALAALKPSVAAAAPEIRLARPVRAAEQIRVEPGERNERNERRNIAPITQPAAPGTPAAPAIAPPQPAQPQLAPPIRVAPVDRLGRPGEERQRMRGEPRQQPEPAQAPVQKNEPPVAAPPIRTINIGPAPRLAAPVARPPAEPASRPPAAAPVNPNDDRRPNDRSDRSDRTARPAHPQEIAPPQLPAAVPAVRPAPPTMPAPPTSARPPAAEQLVAPPSQHQPRSEAVPAQRSMPSAREAPPAQRIEPERRQAAPQPAANQPAARPTPAEAGQQRREQHGEAKDARNAERPGEKAANSDELRKRDEDVRNRK